MPEPPLSEAYVAGMWAVHSWLVSHGSPTVRMAAPLLRRYIRALIAARGLTRPR